MRGVDCRRASGSSRSAGTYFSLAAASHPDSESPTALQLTDLPRDVVGLIGEKLWAADPSSFGACTAASRYLHRELSRAIKKNRTPQFIDDYVRDYPPLRKIDALMHFMPELTVGAATIDRALRAALPAYLEGPVRRETTTFTTLFPEASIRTQREIIDAAARSEKPSETAAAALRCNPLATRNYQALIGLTESLDRFPRETLDHFVSVIENLPPSAQRDALFYQLHSASSGTELQMLIIQRFQSEHTVPLIDELTRLHGVDVRRFPGRWKKYFRAEAFACTRYDIEAYGILASRFCELDPEQRRLLLRSMHHNVPGHEDLLANICRHLEYFSAAEATDILLRVAQICRLRTNEFECYDDMHGFIRPAVISAMRSPHGGAAFGDALSALIVNALDHAQSPVLYAEIFGIGRYLPQSIHRKIVERICALPDEYKRAETINKIFDLPGKRTADEYATLMRMTKSLTHESARFYVYRSLSEARNLSDAQFREILCELQHPSAGCSATMLQTLGRLSDGIAARSADSRAAYFAAVGRAVQAVDGNSVHMRETLEHFGENIAANVADCSPAERGVVSRAGRYLSGRRNRIALLAGLLRQPSLLSHASIREIAAHANANRYTGAAHAVRIATAAPHLSSGRWRIVRDVFAAPPAAVPTEALPGSNS